MVNTDRNGVEKLRSHAIAISSSVKELLAIQRCDFELVYLQDPANDLLERAKVEFADDQQIQSLRTFGVDHKPMANSIHVLANIVISACNRWRRDHAAPAPARRQRSRGILDRM